MLKRLAAATLFLASASAATAFAADQPPKPPPAIYRNPENVVVTGPLAKTGPDTHWIFVDGESGWQLRQPAYAWRDGILVPIDPLPRHTARPKLADDVWADPDERYRSAG